MSTLDLKKKHYYNKLSTLDFCVQCEKANGCYIVSVATIELLISLLEHALESDASMVGELTASVQFILSEVFACYQQWQKSELESFENLGRLLLCRQFSYY